MKPIEVYQTYLALKNHFTKDNYDFFKYRGKSRVSKVTFNKRKDRYFFERMSRKRTDKEIRDFSWQVLVSLQILRGCGLDKSSKMVRRIIISG